MSSIIPSSPSAGPKITLGEVLTEKAASQRADFIPDKFDNLVEWHGLRLAWSRATQCPCVPTNGQTEQADPSCGLCQGAGFLYFNDPAIQDPALVGDLTPVQQKLCRPGQACVIRGLMMGMGTTETQFEKLGRLVEGGASVTVRWQNRLGKLDRLVNLDSYIIHTEKVELINPLAPLRLRYLVDGGVNLLASATQRYVPDEDFTVVDGDVVFIEGRAPEVGTWLTAHYNYHPQYLVIQQPHASRLTYTPNVKRSVNTPQGGVTQFPLQAILQLDWLVGDNVAGVLP